MVQDDVFNLSRFNTVIGCALTTNVQDLRNVREWVPTGILVNLGMVLGWAVVPVGLSLFLILVICAGAGLSQRRWRVDN